MKKLFLCSILLSFFNVSSVYSHYFGNPYSVEIPEKGFFLSKENVVGVKLGYQGDFTFNEKLEMEKPTKGFNKDVSRFRFQDHLGVLTLNIMDRVEVYGGLGIMSSFIRHKPFEDVKLEYDSNQNLIWEAGGRASIIYWGDTVFGLDAKYLKSLLNVDEVKVNGKTVSSSGTDQRLHKWQLGGAIAHRIGFFIPYAGMAFFNTHVKIDKLKQINKPNFPSRITLTSTKRVILFLGSSLSSDRFVAFTIEGQFLAKWGVSGSAVFKF